MATEGNADEPWTIDGRELSHQLRTAAHDLRSLLGPVIGYSDLILQCSDLEQAKRHADRIALAASRIEDFADRLNELGSLGGRNRE